MNSVQENKVSMYYTVRTFFADHLAALIVYVANLAIQFGLLSDAIDDLAEHDQEATEPITGYSIQKNVYRENMRNKALGIAGSVRAWAIVEGVDSNVKKATIPKSALDTERDTDVLFMCNQLFKLATANAVVLEGYGVSAAKLAALGTAIDVYENYIQRPTTERTDAAAMGRAVDADIVKIDGILRVIDGMMDAVAEDEPILYDQYKFSRQIIDNASGGTTPPDITLTLEPNSFTNVYTIPYVASRSFKAKNLSDYPLLWGLSNVPESFSNPTHDLEAGAVSTKLSSTLGPDCDFLVFQNPNPASANIEITIME